MLKRTESAVKREEILYSFFDHVKDTGGTLFINGDLFDFYFEYQDVIPKVYAPFYYQILKLRESGVKVHYVLGNHDYWVMDLNQDGKWSNEDVYLLKKIILKVENNNKDVTGGLGLYFKSGSLASRMVHTDVRGYATEWFH